MRSGWPVALPRDFKKLAAFPADLHRREGGRGLAVRQRRLPHLLAPHIDDRRLASRHASKRSDIHGRLAGVRFDFEIREAHIVRAKVAPIGRKSVGELGARTRGSPRGVG